MHTITDQIAILRVRDWEKEIKLSKYLESILADQFLPLLWSK